MVVIAVVDRKLLQPIAMNLSAMRKLIVELCLNGLLTGSATTRQIMKDTNMMEVIAVDQMSILLTAQIAFVVLTLQLV